jgi:alkylated DNA repair dioxygenase AlkB
MAALPEGFVYQPEFIMPAAEVELVRAIQQLDFSEVKMHGVVARRRTSHYGWLYGYQSWRVTPGPPIPDFLAPLRGDCARAAGVEANDLAEALISEYPPGAGIGWHRDAPMFGMVVAISLLSSCRLRFRRGEGRDADKAEIVIDPRSLYILSGSARTDWQHHIPPGKVLRYSVTFRTMRAGKKKGPA